MFWNSYEEYLKSQETFGYKCKECGFIFKEAPKECLHCQCEFFVELKEQDLLDAEREYNSDEE